MSRTENDAFGKLVQGFLDACIKFALGLCDAQALVAPVAGKQKSAPRILVHASAEDFREQFLHPASQPAPEQKKTVARAPISRKRSVTSEALVMKQIHFRNERNRSRRRRQHLAAVESSHSIAESDEDTLFAARVRIAAVIVVQNWGRAYLHGIEEESADGEAQQQTPARQPVFRRASYVAPTTAEFDNRLATLGRRFPDTPPASIEAALRDCNGHAGCAAGELLAKQAGAVS